MSLRNRLYDQKILESKKYGVPVICIGNLSVGGTGKSPMVEFLISFLIENHKIATLSRGYKRKTKGFVLLNGKEKAAEVGDEPLQFKSKFPEVIVAVDEVRTHGIEQLLDLEDPPEVILLDDAFQHRKVSASLNILLTPFGNLYSKDHVLPTGNLREPVSGAERAHVIVVTKCPSELGLEEKNRVRKELGVRPHQELFFSKIQYQSTAYGLRSSASLSSFRNRKFTLVTGIAGPGPLISFLREEGLEFDHMAFADHHNFTPLEIKKLRKKSLILTTEKDFMRLKDEMEEGKLFFLPIKVELLEGKERFEAIVDSQFKKK